MIGEVVVPMRVNILGILISAINMDQAVQNIDDWIKHKTPYYVCVTPIHGVMECQHNPGLRKIFNSSGMTTPDGMGIVWLLKLKGFHEVSRVYGPDLMRAVCERSVNGGNYKHFLYGGDEGVARKLADNLEKYCPGIQIVGAYTPPFRPLTAEEDHEVIQMINSSKADIVWVGISTPKQELWMAEHFGKLDAPVMVGVGAAFDFLSGVKPQAPRWIQRIGMEWLFRLLSEPRRLWRRYAQYPFFFILVIGQLIGIKKY